MGRRVILGLLLALAAAASAGPRSAAEVLAFKRHNPCPSTGERRGACPGYHVDHKIPLCLSGPDTRDNMQWLSIADHKAKTKQDVRSCRALKHIDYQLTGRTRPTKCELGYRWHDATVGNFPKLVCPVQILLDLFV